VLPLLESEGRGDAVALSEGAWASLKERLDLSGTCLSGMFKDKGGVVEVELLILLAVKEDAESTFDWAADVFEVEERGVGSGVGEGEALGDALLELFREDDLEGIFLSPCTNRDWN